MVTTHPRERQRAVIMMLICAVLWSLSGLLIKMLPWHAFVIAGLRSLISAVVVGIYMAARHIKPRINRASAVGAFALCATSLLFVMANQMTSSANAIVMMYTSPVFLMLISTLVYKQHFTRRDVTTVAVTVAGVALCFFDQMNAGSMLGNILGVISGFTMAVLFTSTGNTNFDSRMSGLFFAHILTGIVGMPFALFYDTPVTRVTVTVILLLGVVQLGIPYLLYGIAVTHCPPLMCSLLSAIEPILNPVWVFLALGDIPGPIAIFGCSLVILSVTVYNVISIRSIPVGEADLNYDENISKNVSE